MERAKLANGKKTESANTKSARAPMNKIGRTPKAEKLVCRYCGSDDLAPELSQAARSTVPEVFYQTLRFSGAGEEGEEQRVTRQEARLGIGR